MKKLLKKLLVFLCIATAVFGLGIQGAGAEETEKITIFDDKFYTSYTKTSSSLVVTETEPDSGNGTASFSITADQGYTRGIKLPLGSSAYDLKDKEAVLHFKVKSETTVKPYMRLDIYSSYTVNSHSYIIKQDVTTDWKEYALPLSSFAATANGSCDLSAVTELQIQVLRDTSETTIKYYFDDVYISYMGQAAEKTFNPDAVIFDEGDESSFSDINTMSVCDTTASEGKKSAKIDYSSASAWEPKYITSSTVALTKEQAECGYLSFKYKCDTSKSGNIVFKIQRVIDSTNWNYAPGAVTLSTSDTWKQVIIPLKDLIDDELDSVDFETQNYKYAKFYIIANGFQGILYIDEAGLYFPKFSADLVIDGEAAEKIDIGEVCITAEIRGVYSKPFNIYCAVYSDNTLTAIQKKDYNSLAGEDTAEFNLSINSSGMNVKLFAWQTGTLLPLSGIPEFESRPVQINYMYPGFKWKALTFSCDDGAYTSDKKMIELLNKYDLTASFNIVGSYMAGDKGTWYASVAQKDMYSGFEIASHTYSHPRWDTITVDEAKEDISKNQAYIKEVFGYAPDGLVWSYDNPGITELDEYIKTIGIKYTRNAKSNPNSFDLPADWYNWTQIYANTDNINTYGDVFLNLKYEGSLKLCAFWLHSWEWNNDGKWLADSDEQWGIMESFMAKAAADNNIWSCTNIEVCKYAEALEKLEIGKTKISNPSDIDVYLQINNKNVIIKAGESYSLFE